MNLFVNYLFILCEDTTHTYMGYVMYTPCYLGVVCVFRAHMCAHEWCIARA